MFGQNLHMYTCIVSDYEVRAFMLLGAYKMYLKIKRLLLNV